MALVDPRDMLNNFCFHVYAKKSNEMKMAMLFFDTITIITRAPDIRVHRAGSQLKIKLCHEAFTDWSLQWCFA